MQKGNDIPNSTTIPSLGNFFISMLSKESFIQLFPLHKPRRNDINGLTVIMITAGEGHLKINTKDHLVHPGTLISLLPFHLIENHYLSDDFACKYLSYSFDFMVDFPFVLKSGTSERIGNKPYLSLTNEEFNHLGRILRFYFPPGSQTRSSLPGGDHQSLTFLLHRGTQFHLLSPNRTRGYQSPKTNCRRFLPAIAPAPQTRTLPIVLCRQTLHDIEIPIEHTETNHRLLPLPVDNEFQPARSQSIIEIIGHEYHPDFRGT